VACVDVSICMYWCRLVETEAVEENAVNWKELADQWPRSDARRLVITVTIHSMSVH